MTPRSAPNPSPLPPPVRALGLVSLFNDAASEMIYPLLPAFMAGPLGLGVAGAAVFLGVLEGAAESLASLLKLVSGRLSDRLQKRKGLTVAGYAVSGCARPLMALARGFWFIFALRLFDRVGKGLRSAPRDALIADIVPPEQRGRAYGFQRALDHLGAVIGPLLAAGILFLSPDNLRLVFALAALPVAGALITLIFFVREKPGQAKTSVRQKVKLNPAFWKYLVCVFLFTLGNSSDAFLLLRAQDLGVSLVLIPLLWSAFHVVKSATSTPGGRLSDSWGRRRTLLLGWGWYALVYAGFALAESAWQAWALFLLYGLFFGLTEGVERALVADLVGEQNRGYAFGWFHLAVGIGALPASLIFGFVWQAAGPQTAFFMGAALALLAAGLLGVMRLKNN